MLKRKDGFLLSFLGSGDFHHLSGILLEKFKEPYYVILLDKHYDVGSEGTRKYNRYHCGGWFSNVLEREECVGGMAIGAASLSQTVSRYLHRISKLEKEQNLSTFPLTKKVNQPPFEEIIKTIPKNTNIYISIDKDVLSDKVVHTDWGSGWLEEEPFLKLLTKIKNTFGDNIIGVDVCGDPNNLKWFPEEEWDGVLRTHAKLNKEIINIFSDKLEKNKWKLPE